MRKVIVIIALMKTLVLNAAPPVLPGRVIVPVQPVPRSVLPPANVGQTGRMLPGQLPFRLGGNDSSAALPSTNSSLPRASEFRAAIPPSPASSSIPQPAVSPAPPPNYTNSEYESILATLSVRDREDLLARLFIDLRHQSDPRILSGEMRIAERYRIGQYNDFVDARNYLQSLRGSEITMENILEANRIIVRSLAYRDPELLPGQLRDIPIYQGTSGGIAQTVTQKQFEVLGNNPYLQVNARIRTLEGVIVGVEYLEASRIEAEMQTLLTRINSGPAAGQSPVEWAAQIQREFVSIHPFLDGNGRLSRVLMNELLARMNITPSLIANPNLDTHVSLQEWAQQVQEGIDRYQNLIPRPVGSQ